MKRILKLLMTDRHIGAIVAVSIGSLFFILAHQNYYEQLDYTFRLASAFINGHLGLASSPIWLNELIPHGNVYYSAFPLGSILSVLPFSILVSWHILGGYPVAAVVGIIAGVTTWLCYRYSLVRRDLTAAHRIILATWLLFGTWYLTNLLFAGAWHLALGFAVLGELGALAYTISKPNPALAGLFFALAFGNRSEIVFTAPIFFYFLLRTDFQQSGRSTWKRLSAWKKVGLFSLTPALLGLATLAYNQLRFGSIADFGYSHIPGVLNEPLYSGGIFSLVPVSENAHQMLWQGWKHLDSFPYFVPTGFGGSIFLASPFLLLLLRRWHGQRHRLLASALAIFILTATLWLHGNPGGWQYSYRYAMILLPWVLVIFIEILPNRITKLEAGLWIASLSINSYATYLFMWTKFVQP